ncbi:DUF5723 family protein [Christiangramia forsetii]|uniref:DUF5723 domain-containing protein n=1 Tax=Christiangramia forsetii (strain DSM 17595 / CGMCC 1.15422 / KT0803) TaxID=411154 RepID=A0M5B5_CHRFK|nr:DUF5723 family protein [Christiangramia forsetii]CAL67810.1 conserved hypothetical protein, secreted [Christiangramia forsetii KT0803]
MRKIVLILFLLISTFSFGQNRPLLYNVDDLPQSLLQNPGARIDFTRHFGIPFFSQLHLSAGSTGVTAHDIFSDENGNVNERVRNVMNTITAGDYFSINEQMEILSLGWKIGNKGYFSAGIYQELDVFAYFPKDPAVLAFEGNADYINQDFNFSDVSFTGEVLAVYHAGFNYKVDRKLTVGGRLKLYSGIFNAESTGNEGVFRTVQTPNGPNFYRHEVDGLNVIVNTSGYASLKVKDSITVDGAVADLLSRSLLGQNVGVGIDLGFNYRVTDQFSINGSVQDLGLMFHQKDLENSNYFGSFQTNGLEPLFPELDGSESAIPYWDVFEERLDANLRDETTANEYTTWRPLKFNASFEFGTGKSILPCDYLISKRPRFMNLFGMLISGVNRPKGPTYGVTAYWDRKVNDNLRFRLAYAVDEFSLTKLGAMVSSRFKNFNIYLAANDIMGYTNLAKANSASLQLGLQFIFKDL